MDGNLEGGFLRRNESRDGICYLASRSLPTKLDDLEDWLHLARVVEIRDEDALNMTLGQIWAHMLAWFDREKAKEKARLLVNGEEDAPVTDGPTEPFTWTHEGTVIGHRMHEAAWNLVSHLWQCRHRSEYWNNLGEPVYGDAEHSMSHEVVPSLRKKANKFFSEYDIPYRVSVHKGKKIGDERVILKEKQKEPG